MMIRNVLLVAGFVTALMVPTVALAEPIEVGCRDADIEVRVRGVACVGIHYPPIEQLR